MDNLVNIVKRFYSLGKNESNIMFARVMLTIITIIEEKWIDNRQFREVNEFYGLVCENLINIRRNLQEYIKFEEIYDSDTD